MTRLREYVYSLVVKAKTNVNGAAVERGKQ